MFLIMLLNIAQSKNYLVEVNDEEGGSNEDNPASDQEEVSNEDVEGLNDDIESEEIIYWS